MQREVREIGSKGEWLDWRRQDVTASRIGALFDCHPYLAKQQLAEIMLGLTSAGSSSPPDNPAMRRGRIFEAAVAAAVAEEKPDWLIEKASQYCRLVDERLGCTPDYWATDERGRGLIEVKTVTQQVWDKHRGQPPLYHLLQTATELLVTDRAWGIIATMVMGGSYTVHYHAVPRHAEAEERILRAVACFHRDLAEGVLGLPASAEGLAQLYDDGSTIDLSDDNEIRELLDAREMANAGVKAREERLKEIDAAIKQKLGDAAKGWLPGWSLSYGVHHRKETLIPAKDIRTLRVRRTRAEQEEEEHAE
jgi:predicted phage-related endonuclease